MIPIKNYMQLSEILACWGHSKRFDRREVSQATPHLQLLEETAVKLWQQQAGENGTHKKGPAGPLIRVHTASARTSGLDMVKD